MGQEIPYEVGATKVEKAAPQDDESTITKVAREAYVFGVGTFGGAIREAVDSVVERPKDTAIKLAESVGVGVALAASQLGPLPVKVLGRVAAAGLGISFFSDAVSPSRWKRLGEAARDTWRSGANTERNVKIVQGSLGHLVFDSALMLGGAKLGTGLVRKGIESRFGPPRSESILLKNLPATSETTAALMREAAMAGAQRPELPSTNPVEQFNQSGYKFVPGKMAAVQARTYDGKSIGFSNNGQNMLIGDQRGNLTHMRARKGAMPEEVAHLVMIDGFTQLIKEDAFAWDAARKAAIDGSSIFKTKSMLQEAAHGSEAYVTGNSGNAYTAYLRERFGDWTSRDSAWATHILNNVHSPESPWNPSYVPATETLFAVGEPITPANRAAASNSHVSSLPLWERKTSIEAVAKLADEWAHQQYPGADPMVHAVAVGRFAPAMSAAEVRAARAIKAESSGADLSVESVQSVVRLVESGVAPDAAQAYRALQVASFTPAAKLDKLTPPAESPLPQRVDITGVPEQAGARSTAPAHTVAGAEKAAAEHLLLNMHEAGFKLEHMLDANIVSVAKAIHYESRGNLVTAAQTARILGSSDISVSRVMTVQAMIDAGWNSNQIQRPDVWTAQAILANRGYATPAEVRKLRYDERFIPRPDARVPQPIGEPLP